MPNANISIPYISSKGMRYVIFFFFTTLTAILWKKYELIFQNLVSSTTILMGIKISEIRISNDHIKYSGGRKG